MSQQLVPTQKKKIRIEFPQWGGYNNLTTVFEMEVLPGEKAENQKTSFPK